MIIRNSLLSLLSLGLPLLVGIVTVPIIIADLGLERFGVLTLVWAVIGYASLFDLGISRALTKRVAELHDNRALLGSVVRSGLYLLGVLGAAMGLLMLLLTSLFDYQRFGLGQAEFRNSVLLMALNIPLVIVSGGLRGALEGVKCFSVVSGVRLGFGLITFLAPLLALEDKPELDLIIGIMLLARVIGCMVMGWACKSLFALRVTKAVSKARRQVEIKRLLRFGGWITVSNLASAVMLYADRFFLAYSPFAGSLAFYTTPYEFVTRLFIVPAALSGVLFPYIARDKSFNDINHRLLLIAGAMTLALVMPVVTALILFAPEILALWISPAFSASAALPMRILSVGVLVNCVGQIYQTFILGRGKAFWMARLHIVEMLLFLPCVYTSLHCFGIEGVAWAWTLRVMMDAFAMLMMLRQLDSAAYRSGGYLLAGLSLSMSMLACSGLEITYKALFLAAVSSVCGLVVIRLSRHSLAEGHQP